MVLKVCLFRIRREDERKERTLCNLGFVCPPQMNMVKVVDENNVNRTCGNDMETDAVLRFAGSATKERLQQKY